MQIQRTDLERNCINQDDGGAGKELELGGKWSSRNMEVHEKNKNSIWRLVFQGEMRQAWHGKKLKTSITKL